MARYGMVIDLKRCIGCQACTVACKAENFVPPGIKWNRVLDYTTGKYPNVSRHFLPMPCMHCVNAPCVQVCPTGASYKRADGIVLTDYDKCMGCRYCDIACPYDRRYFYEEKVSYFPPGFIPPEEFKSDLLGVKAHQVGTVQKCTFCVHRIDAGIQKGLMPGVDWEASPACVNACPTGARIFGDLDDPDSEVSRLIVSRRGYQLLPELGTEPSVYYLPV